MKITNKYKNEISLETFKEAVQTSLSIAEVFRKLDMYLNCYTKFHSIIKFYNISIEHFKPDMNRIFSYKFRKTKTVPIENYLVKDCKVHSTSILKQRLIKEKLLEYKCYICNNNGFWQNQKLTLQLDHINGIRDDNRIENLRILCPNCHTQTDTYCGKKLIIKTKEKNCKKCGNKFFSKKKICNDCIEKNLKFYNTVTNKPGYLNICINEGCFRTTWIKDSYCSTCKIYDPNYKKRQSNIKWPPKEELEKLVWEKPVTSLAKDLKVSEGVLRKHCKRLQIKKPGKGYWQKRDSEKYLKNNWPSNEELKRLVWEKPIKQLAKDMKFSISSIQNRCEKLQIEKPPLNYWLRKNIKID